MLLAEEFASSACTHMCVHAPFAGGVGNRRVHCGPVEGLYGTVCLRHERHMDMECQDQHMECQWLDGEDLDGRYGGCLKLYSNIGK